jgi:hypothetical protein
MSVEVFTGSIELVSFLTFSITTGVNDCVDSHHIRANAWPLDSQ